MLDDVEVRIQPREKSRRTARRSEQDADCEFALSTELPGLVSGVIGLRSRG